MDKNNARSTKIRRIDTEEVSRGKRKKANKRKTMKEAS